jgi:16S rRNA processing protein RimM
LIDNKEYLKIGVITGTHGLNGRLKIFVITDDLNRFSIDNQIYLLYKNEYKEYRITDFVEPKKKIALLKLENIDSIDIAERYKNVNLFIDKLEAELTKKNLKEDSFYYYDIIDCEVFMNKEKFGVVKEIFQAGSGDILIITDKDNKEYMIPFIESMVDISKIDQKKIEITPAEGLFDL